MKGKQAPELMSTLEFLLCAIQQTFMIVMHKIMGGILSQPKSTTKNEKILIKAFGRGYYPLKPKILHELFAKYSRGHVYMYIC